MPWHLMFAALLLDYAPLTGLSPTGVISATKASISPVVPTPALDSTVDSVAPDGFDTQRAPFEVEFGAARDDYRVMAMFVVPSQSVPVAVQAPPDPGPVGEYELTAAQGRSL